jgi:uncharacterized protein
VNALEPNSKPQPAPRRRWRRRLIGLGAVVLLAFLAMNLLCYRHAVAFTNYAAAGERPPKPESLSFTQKLRIGLTGIPVPRPTNTATPAKVKLDFETHTIPLGDEQLEAWFVEHPQAKGIVVMGHGYMTSKESLLPELRGFHELGYSALLIDFRGSGGSSRSDVTLGVREGEDFAQAIRFATEKWPTRPILAYGFSMGAAAVLRAIAHHDCQPSAIILDAPFDRMLNVVRNRFNTMNVPNWPASEVLLFWGGRNVGIDGFAHNPCEDARRVSCPALILHGEHDPRATRTMVEAVHGNIPSRKKLVTFEKAGHDPLARVDQAKWRQELREFLPP